MKMSLKQGDLENIILNALWDLEADGHTKIFVGDVQEKIKSERADSKEWAYTTVKTVLDRLVDKEIALREKDGKKYLYRSVLKRDEAGALALSKLIRQYFRNDISNLESCLSRIKHEFESKPYATPPTSGTLQPGGSPAAFVADREKEFINS
jgi:BlaI family transcriptional regulator, penicillinase repressor